VQQETGSSKGQSSQMQDQICILDKQKSVLEAQIGSLYERLGPVLKPETEAPPSAVEHIVPGPGPLAPVPNSLRQLASDLRVCSERVGDILERLAV